LSKPPTQNTFDIFIVSYSKEDTTPLRILRQSLILIVFFVFYSLLFKGGKLLPISFLDFGTFVLRN